jgi:two-component system probable response regulator PhcQ
VSSIFLRVLLVDDESHILSAYKRALRSLRPQWEVRTANSGHDAVKQMEKHGFEVLVTDIGMSGMDGIDLLTRAQSMFPQTFRLVVSGMIDGRTLVELNKVAQAHLIKPVTTEKLVERIEALVNQEPKASAEPKG